MFLGLDLYESYLNNSYRQARIYETDQDGDLFDVFNFYKGGGEIVLCFVFKRRDPYEEIYL